MSADANGVRKATNRPALNVDLLPEGVWLNQMHPKILVHTNKQDPLVRFNNNCQNSFFSFYLGSSPDAASKILKGEERKCKRKVKGRSKRE